MTQGETRHGSGPSIRDRGPDPVATNSTTRALAELGWLSTRLVSESAPVQIRESALPSAGAMNLPYVGGDQPPGWRGLVSLWRSTYYGEPVSKSGTGIVSCDGRAPKHYHGRARGLVRFKSGPQLLSFLPFSPKRGYFDHAI